RRRPGRTRSAPAQQQPPPPPNHRRRPRTATTDAAPRTAALAAGSAAFPAGHAYSWLPSGCSSKRLDAPARGRRRSNSLISEREALSLCRRRIISIIAPIESGQASAQRPSRSVHISLTRRERIARGDSRWRLAGGDDDLLVGLQDEICRVARLRLPVQPPVQLAAVAAEAAPADADAP